MPDLKINCLLAGEDGDLWIGTDEGVARWTGGEVTPAGRAGRRSQNLPALAMIRDRDANVWIAAGARGLLRVNARGVVSLRRARTRAAAATSRRVFEDRDGNLWVGTTKGIERLRDGVFTTYSAAQGLPSDGVGPVYVDAAHRTGSRRRRAGCIWLRDGRVGRVDQAGLDDDVVYSIAGDATRCGSAGSAAG